MTPTDGSALVSTAWALRAPGESRMYTSSRFHQRVDDALLPRSPMCPGGALVVLERRSLARGRTRAFAAPGGIGGAVGDAWGVGARMRPSSLYGEPVQFRHLCVLGPLKMGGVFQNLKLMGRREEKNGSRDGMPCFRARSPGPGGPSTHPAPVEGGDFSAWGRGRYSRKNSGIRAGCCWDVRSPEEYRGERVMPPPGFRPRGRARPGAFRGRCTCFFRELLNADGHLQEHGGTCGDSRRAQAPAPR